LPRCPSAVVFDMDGTLHDTEVVYHASLKRAVAAVGYAVTDAFCHSLIGIPGRECDVILREHLGSAFPYDQYDRLRAAYINDALDTAVPVKTGAVELLQVLSRSGMKLAVATSATRRSAERSLGRSGLVTYFPVVVTRDDVARGKPHPDLFVLAAERLGVQPEDCLAVEDSLHGIRAAHAAGMMPVMVPDLLTPTEEIRALCVRIALDLHEVNALLAAHVAAES